MRVRLLAAAGAVSMSLVACAATTEGPAPTSSADPTLPAPGAGEGAPDAAPAEAAPAGPDCSLAALADVGTVDAVFVAAGAPPAMTGGVLDGEYVVDDAKVFLPSGSAGLVDTRASSGTISAWAVFTGTRYRLSLRASFTLATVAGTQSQGVDTASQGGFTTSGAAIALDHACDAALTDEADYSFTDDGSGRATILIKTPTPYGDTYLALAARKF